MMALVLTVRRGVRRGAAGLLIFVVRLYRATLSPLLGGECRFRPTCSEYFIEAVRTHGCVRGALMGIWRICRCHPFSAGGIDPVPPAARSERPPAE